MKRVKWLRPKDKHAGGLLSFPGGKVDEGDEIDEWNILCNAVKREVFEEVGLTLLDPIEYIVSNYFIDSADSIFYCKLNKTLPHVIASKREVSEYYWMSPEEINTAVNSPAWLKKYIEFILQHKKLYSTF